MGDQCGCNDGGGDTSVMLSLHVLIDQLNQVPCHTVQQLVFIVTFPIVEKDCVLPLFTNEALVSGRHLPAQDIEFVEQIELLMAKEPVQDELVLDRGTSTHSLKLRALELELVLFQIVHFSLHLCCDLFLLG